MNPISSLNPKREAFADVQQELAAKIDNGDTLDTAVVEDVVNKAIELIEGLEVAASLPRNVYGPRYDTSNQQYNQPGRDFVQNQHVAPHSVTHHTTEVNLPGERFYRLSTDLIVSTSGGFTFKPETRKLFTVAGIFDLTETEAVRLESFLHNDFNC